MALAGLGVESGSAVARLTSIIRPLNMTALAVESA